MQNIFIANNKLNTLIPNKANCKLNMFSLEYKGN